VALAVPGIDVEACLAGRCGDQKIFQLVLIAEILDYIPEARMDQELFVVAEAVEEIEDRETEGLVGVEGGREDDAIGDGAGEDFAGDGVALDAAGGGVKWEGE